MAEEIKIEIKGVDKFSTTFNKLTSKLPSVKTLAVGAGAAITGFGAAIAAMTKQTANAYDAVGKFASRINISTSALSKYHYAAELSGVKTTALNIALQRMTRRIGEATTGIGQANPAFEAMGLAIEDIVGKSPDKQFEAIAAALDKVKNSSEKTALAAKIFDSEGVAVLQMLTSGTAGLQKMKEEAEKFGLVITSKAAKNAAEFNDSLTRLQGAFKGLRNYMAEQFMPILTSLANNFANFIANNRDSIIAFGKKVISVLGKIVEYGAYGVAALIDSWRGLQMIWEVLKIALASFAEAFVAALDWMVEKYGSFLEAVNVGGIFNEEIASVNAFKNVTGGVIAELQNMGQTAKDNLDAIIDEGMAVSKVAAIKEAVVNAINEISETYSSGAGNASSGESGSGILPSGESGGGDSSTLTDGQAEAIAQLHTMWEEYYLTEEERLDNWYALQLEKIYENDEAKLELYQVYEARKTELDIEAKKQEEERQKAHEAKLAAIQAMRLNATKTMLGNIGAVSKEQGKKGFALYKATAIAETVITTYQSAMKAFSSLASIPIIGPVLGAAAAAAAIAFGLMQVSKIASQKPPAAHGGLTNVPEEQTYLLNQGERVLSPNQNKDLVEFLQGQKTEIGEESATEVTNNIEVHVLENATNAEALMHMGTEDWNDVVEEKIIPSMNKLALRGIKPVYI